MPAARRLGPRLSVSRAASAAALARLDQEQQRYQCDERDGEDLERLEKAQQRCLLHGLFIEAGQGVGRRRTRTGGAPELLRVVRVRWVQPLKVLDEAAL